MWRKSICAAAALLLLFAQLSIAAYACPALAAASAQANTDTTANENWSSAGDEAASDDLRVPANGIVACDQMAVQQDKASPELCAGHCHYGQQVDQVNVFSLTAFALISLYVVAPTTIEICPSMSAMAASMDVPVAASPPHAILHCCFRI